MIKYLRTQKDIIVAIRAVFTLGLWSYIPIVYGQTRDYSGGLELAEYLRQAIRDRRADITDEEFVDWDSAFIGLMLLMLDYSNRWRDYIELFESVRELPYYETSAPKKMADEYRGFTVEADENNYHVHFLWRYRGQYEAMRKKYTLWASGRKMGKHLRHQQDKLSTEEIQKRVQFITMQLEHYISDLRRRGVAGDNYGKGDENDAVAELKESGT